MEIRPGIRVITLFYVDAALLESSTRKDLSCNTEILKTVTKVFQPS